MTMSNSDMKDTQTWKRDLKVLGLIFLISTGALLVTLQLLVASALTTEEASQIRFPTSLEAAQQLGDALNSFASKYQFRLVLAHMCCYLYLQSFAIPGTVFFNLLGGALFGVQLGFPLCLTYNTIGSISMYLLSKYFGTSVVRHFFHQKLETLRTMVDEHRDDQALYMIFLRVFPFSPNWFINIAAPHLDVPIFQFSLGPAIGLIPYNFLSCKAGLVLKELRSKGDIIDTATTIQLIILAIIGIFVLPPLKRRFSQKKKTRVE